MELGIGFLSVRAPYVILLHSAWNLAFFSYKTIITSWWGGRRILFILIVTSSNIVPGTKGHSIHSLWINDFPLTEYIFKVLAMWTKRSERNKQAWIIFLAKLIQCAHIILMQFHMGTSCQDDDLNSNPGRREWHCPHFYLFGIFHLVAIVL